MYPLHHYLMNIAGDNVVFLDEKVINFDSASCIVFMSRNLQINFYRETTIRYNHIAFNF